MMKVSVLFDSYLPSNCLLHGSTFNLSSPSNTSSLRNYLPNKFFFLKSWNIMRYPDRPDKLLKHYVCSSFSKNSIPTNSMLFPRLLLKISDFFSTSARLLHEGKSLSGGLKKTQTMSPVWSMK